MPPIFGLQSKGFKTKDFATIKYELEDHLRKEVDPTLDFGPGSVAGMLTAIVAHQAKQVWEVAHGLYHSLQPSAATGRALDELCSLTGTHRRHATHSRITAVVTLAAGITLPKGSRIETLGGHSLVTTAEVKNRSSFTADKEADFIADKPGPVIAHKDIESKIMTPVAGWSKAVIKATYELGNYGETDYHLRLRRIRELRATGSSTRAALQTFLLKKVDGVEAVYIKEGTSSFEALVKGGKDEAIAQALWLCKPLGIETRGKVHTTITDSIGQTRIVHFSRPQIVAFTLNVTLKTRRVLEQAELDAIKNAFLDFATRHFTLGAEVYPARFYMVALKQPQVLDITQLHIKPKTGSSFGIPTIGPEQIADLRFADITIQQILEVNR
jgi:uncharacterized phage protein gp47/JayE